MLNPIGSSCKFPCLIPKYPFVFVPLKPQLLRTPLLRALPFSFYPMFSMGFVEIVPKLIPVNLQFIIGSKIYNRSGEEKL